MMLAKAIERIQPINEDEEEKNDIGAENVESSRSRSRKSEDKEKSAGDKNKGLYRV